MKYFISGWAGFKEALNVPDDWYFIIPFINLEEEGILDFLKDKSGKTLIGWSTGGHLVLKNLSFFSQRFCEIVVVAGFKKFTDYVHPRVLKRMIDKIKKNPEAVIKDFLFNAGAKTLIPEKIEQEKLIKGLKFLMSSQVLDFSIEHAKLTLIQGKNDKILTLKALEDLKLSFPFAKSHIINGSHWISFDEILYLL